MIESLRSRILIIVAVLAFAIIWVLPNVVDLDKKWWFTKDRIVYGLDIQGGLHLVMGVDIDGVLKESSKRLSSTLEEHLKEKQTEVLGIQVTNPTTGEMELKLKSAADQEAVREVVERDYNSLQVIEAEGDVIKVRYYEAVLRDRKSKVVSQSIETLRNRIDEFGVAEPSITAQGTNRILVQLPGIEDAARAKELINKTARLEFMMLHEAHEPAKLAEWIREVEEKEGLKMADTSYSEYVQKLNVALKDKLPKDSVIYFEKSEQAKTIEAGAIPHLLRTDTDLGGDELKDAFVSQDEFGAWQVAINFTPQGGGKFAVLTEKNIGKQMAVVLDKVVKSAPVIQSKIPNGRGVIEMGSSQDVLGEAQLIATALRAGSLPASLEQLEERTVGPSLGADSIAKGKKAGLIGALLVIIFMLFYYKVFGVVANVALGFNILILLAVLSSLGATLTLPGIAGIVLTLGMAVDANVIIFERIKEELRKGAGLSMALKDGYGHAFSAILDANITTAAVCVVLMYFGTGPVRGFAVTLMIGIGASMFTAIFVTRTVFEVMVTKFNMKKIAI